MKVLNVVEFTSPGRAKNTIATIANGKRINYFRELRLKQSGRLADIRGWKRMSRRRRTLTATNPVGVPSATEETQGRKAVSVWKGERRKRKTDMNTPADTRRPRGKRKGKRRRRRSRRRRKNKTTPRLYYQFSFFSLPKSCWLCWMEEEKEKNKKQKRAGGVFYQKRNADSSAAWSNHSSQGTRLHARTLAELVTRSVSNGN